MDQQSTTVVIWLVSAALGYLAVRRSADLTHWGQYVSMACVLSLAGMAYQADATRELPVSISPTFAGITPIEAKALELQWFIAQQRKSQDDRE